MLNILKDLKTNNLHHLFEDKKNINCIKHNPPSMCN